MKSFYAHIREDGTKQTVLEHLLGTAELSREFASAFHADEQGCLVGMAHDIGKYSDAFQSRLLNSGTRVDHSTAGAYECLIRKQPYAAFCVAGHHSGLPDMGGRMDDADEPTLIGRRRRVEQHLLPDYSRWTDEQILPDASKPSSLVGGRIGMDFYVRMLFSCLTDADFLDTERFMNNGILERDRGETIPCLTNKLDSFIQNWYPPKSELNRQRCSILTECIRQGNSSLLMPGVFTLTVPTGGGKTVASLAFALHHAQTHGMQRIVYVIPYTSIIEQTADIFRSILGGENVLEHHSGVVFDEKDEASTDNLSMMRATENWDKPVIVTTAVQFFESLYANRSSKCRKLHNLANSVIVFDEAQMMPLNHLRPCVSAITQLVGNFGASAVLCTATQPALDGIIHEFLPGRNITELCPKTIFDESIFRRVTFSLCGTTSWEQLATQIRETSQALCIVNTRGSAKKLYSLISDTEGSYHLSTLMVPAHRRAYLSEIKERLINGQPCRVVSTSLIEAGIDVDFPLVFRELAGLDSMLQAAGRCNREGKRSSAESIVTIFQSEAAIPPVFEMNAGVARSVIGRFSDISSHEAISEYFNMLLRVTGKNALDKKGIMSKIETLSFASIAKAFHLIENDTATVYIPWGKGAELIQRIKQGEYSRALFREAAQYSVSLYSNHFQNLVNSGDVQAINGQKNLWYLANIALYQERDGLSIESSPGQALFI